MLAAVRHALQFPCGVQLTLAGSLCLLAQALRPTQTRQELDICELEQWIMHSMSLSMSKQQHQRACYPHQYLWQELIDASGGSFDGPRNQASSARLHAAMRHHRLQGIHPSHTCTHMH